MDLKYILDFTNYAQLYGSRKKNFAGLLIVFLFIIYSYTYGVFSTQNKDNLLMDYDSRTAVSLLSGRNRFDINGTDVMVFLHIQKTGGSSLGRHLIHHLKARKCKKKMNRKKSFQCLRPNNDSEWLFSRLTSGWQCGLHADWTSLQECVPEQFASLGANRTRNRYFYITVIREPIARYLSEWGHVSRGATWDVAYLRCNGDIYDYPQCWTGPNWEGVSLDEFMDCSYNLANNRQTRMLADLREINCTGDNLTVEERDKMLLNSAKKNLKNMAFFGLTERQKDMQVLFEATFHLRFKRGKFFNLNSTHATKFNESEEQVERIKKLNNLDVQLYDYAVTLFDERMYALRNHKLSQLQ